LDGVIIVRRRCRALPIALLVAAALFAMMLLAGCAPQYVHNACQQYGSADVDCHIGDVGSDWRTAAREWGEHPDCQLLRSGISNSSLRKLCKRILAAYNAPPVQATPQYYLPLAAQAPTR